MVHPYRSTDIATAEKNSCFILSEKSNLRMTDNQSIVVTNVLSMRIFVSLSVDEILLLRYVNWFTNFPGSFLFKTHEKPPVACFWLCCRHSV